jgi:putative membrane protein
MRVLLWAFRVFIFLFLFAFSLKNTDPVSLHFLFETVWQAPLVIVMLAFFAGGAVLGVLSLLGTVLRLRRQVTRLRRERIPAQAAPARDIEADSEPLA